MIIPEEKKTCSICSNRSKTSDECKSCYRNSRFTDHFTLAKEVEDYVKNMHDPFGDSQDLHTL